MNNELIHDLIVRSFSESLTKEEVTALAAWRSKSSSNEDYYQEILRVWDWSEKAKPSYDPDTDKHWKNLLMKIESEPRTGRVRFLFRDFSFYKVAAAVVLVASLGYLMLHFSSVLLKEITTKQTADNMDVFYLPDSSVVWLNKNSTLTFPKEFDQDQRVVYLKGEAFFDVRKNPDQPFVIHAEGTTTKVLGTSFDIKAYEHDPEVTLTVVTGKVAFSDEHQTLLLLPEETGVYKKSQKQIALRTQNVQVKEKVAWIKNEQAYQGNDVYTMEHAHPEKYLHNTFGSRVNLINQTVVEGWIENNAKVCSYQDIEVKVIYISKKNKVFEHLFRIQEKLNPGQKLAYKEKLPDWFVDTKEVRMTIQSVEGLIIK